MNKPIGKADGPSAFLVYLSIACGANHQEILGYGAFLVSIEVMDVIWPPSEIIGA